MFIHNSKTFMEMKELEQWHIELENWNNTITKEDTNESKNSI